jgi:starvation-inducible outer membrane lipoprotein
MLKVLQVPFRVREDPDSTDHSEGRFVSNIKGFLDPEEVYAGTVRLQAPARLLGLMSKKSLIGSLDI